MMIVERVFGMMELHSFDQGEVRAAGEAVLDTLGLKSEERLRPRSLEEMIGQARLRENLSVFIQAARERGETLDHLLFHGPPGLGKTSLAHVVAHEMRATLRCTSGPAIERAGDLAALLSNLEEGDVLLLAVSCDALDAVSDTFSEK